MEGTIRTQGTELFFVDTLTSSTPALFKMACPTGVTGVGTGTKDQIESTCLDTVGDKEYEAGLGNPATVSVPFNFIPTQQSHRTLMDLKREGTVISWLLCLSDGDGLPSLSGNDIIPPGDRTSVEFSGYVSECSIDVATNEIVRGTLTIQRSGMEVWHWNGDPVEP